MTFSFAAVSRQIHSSLVCIHSQILREEVIGAANELKRLVPMVETFEASPSELDAELAFVVAKISELYLICKEKHDQTPVLAAIASLSYTLTKIRGYKVVANHFSSDVYILPKITGFLAEATSDHEIHMLALWSCRLVLSPFPLESVSKSLAESMYQEGVRLSAVRAGSTQRIVSVMLSKLLERADCEDFRQRWLDEVCESWIYAPEAQKHGFLMVLNQMLKKEGVPELHDVLESESARIRFDASYKPNTAILRYFVKVLAKNTRHLVASCQYAVVARHLSLLLHFFDSGTDTVLRETVAKGLAKITAGLVEKAPNYGSQLVAHVIAMASAGSPHVPMSRLHTVLLFVGFLSLSRTLPAEYIPEILPILAKTLFFSRSRYAHVLTNQVRDASCFCAWALFRQFSTDSLAGLACVQDTFLRLVQVAVFDADFVIRRCAVSCVQEFVGRHGQLLSQIDSLGFGFDVTVRLVELFSFSAVSTLSLSHELIRPLIAMGFCQQMFLQSLMDEICLDTPPESKKLGAVYLRRQLDVAEKSQLDVAEKLPVAATVLQPLADSFQLYALAEIRAHLGDYAESVADKVASLCFRADMQDASFSGESIMHWLNSGSDFHRSYPLVLCISRLSWTPALGGEFQRYFRNVQVDDAVFAEISSQITQAGNELLGCAIFGASLSAAQYERMFSVVRDPKVAAETRAKILRSFRYSAAGPETRRLWHATLLELLDDYSLSERGDVGQHVRSACMQALPECLSGMDGGETRSALLKLVRMSAEQMDRLRVQAYGLVCRITRQKAPLSNDYDEYFPWLMRLVARSDDEVGSAFWDGIVHCAGATTGPNTLINKSFSHLARFVAGSPQRLSPLVALLHVPGKFTLLSHRRQKTVLHALQLWVRIFDCGLVPDCNTNTLFVRLYNLHINTSNLGRLAPVIRVFSHMGAGAGSRPVQKQARQRLVWLHEKHPLESVRLLALEAIFESCAGEDSYYGLQSGVSPQFRSMYLDIN